MTEYNFTLVLGRATPDTEGLEDKLFEAGCDDALICSYNQTVYLEFCRQADSADEAIRSAVADIRTAGFAVRTIQESGVASISEMASRAELTRAALNNYVKGHRGEGDFPEPVYGLASGSPLFDWPEVADWLHTHGKLAKEPLDVAQAARAIQGQTVVRLL